MQFITIREVCDASEQFDYRLEFHKRLAWETTREQIFCIMNMSGKTLKRSISRPQQIMPFEWEINKAKTDLSKAIKMQNQIKRNFNIITELN